jgi:Domain of unknown function (DUF6924)
MGVDNRPRMRPAKPRQNGIFQAAGRPDGGPGIQIAGRPEVQMKNLPDTEFVPLLRTDFSDDAAWETVCRAVRAPVGPFQAYVECISDAALAGLQVDQLLALAAADFSHTFFFVVDRLTLTHPEQPVLVVDAYEEPGRTFRVVPAEMWAVENNLSIANIDWEEFAELLGPDGILRGISGP